MHIEQKASSEGIDPAMLLGLAIAHEFGHLLLGPHAYSAKGIMRANWGHNDILNGARGQLRFIAEQTLRIRANVESRVMEARRQVTRKPRWGGRSGVSSILVPI
jgi:hypothetical protein